MVPAPDFDGYGLATRSAVRRHPIRRRLKDAGAANGVAAPSRRDLAATTLESVMA